MHSRMPAEITGEQRARKGPNRRDQKQNLQQERQERLK